MYRILFLIIPDKKKYVSCLFWSIFLYQALVFMTRDCCQIREICFACILSLSFLLTDPFSPVLPKLLQFTKRQLSRQRIGINFVFLQAVVLDLTRSYFYNRSNYVLAIVSHIKRWGNMLVYYASRQIRYSWSIGRSRPWNDCNDRLLYDSKWPSDVSKLDECVPHVYRIYTASIGGVTKKRYSILWLKLYIYLNVLAREIVLIETRMSKSRDTDW